MHHGQAEAGVHAPAVDMHGAGSALTVVASFLGAGQHDAFPQAVEQRRPRVEAEAVLVSVDAQGQGYGALGAGRRRGFRCWIHRLSYQVIRTDHRSHTDRAGRCEEGTTTKTRLW